MNAHRPTTQEYDTYGQHIFHSSCIVMEDEEPWPPGSKSRRREATRYLIAHSLTEPAMQLLRPELQPLLVWKRRRRDWLRRLRPYGCWPAWHTSVRGRG